MGKGLRRGLVALALALVLWALGGYLLVPWLVERELPTALEARLDARVSLGEARFDPFLMDFELRDLVLEGPLGDGADALTDRITIRRIAVDLQARTLRVLAPVVAVTVEAPTLSLTRAADGTLPISRILPPATEPAATPAATPTVVPRLLLSLSLSDARLRFTDRALPSPKRIDFTLDALAIDDLDTGEGALTVASLALDAPALTARLDATPAPDPVAELAAGAPTRADAIADAAPQQNPGAAPLPFTVRLEALSVDGLALTLEDARLEPAATLAFDAGRLRAGPLALDRTGALAERLDFDFGLAQAGKERLRVSGAAEPATAAPAAVGLRLELDALELGAAKPWVRAATGTELRRGTLSSTLEARWEEALTLQGETRLADIGVRDADGLPLFSLANLDVTGIDLDTAGRSAAVNAIAVDAPRLRFARYADGRSNLDTLLASGKGEPAAESLTEASEETSTETAPGPSPEAAPETAAAVSTASPMAPESDDVESAPWRWRLGGVTVADGFLDFVDEALVTPFSTTVEELSGEAGETSSDAPELTLALAGRVPPVGALDADAVLDLSDPLASTRVELDFRRVSLVRLSPYIGTFAGRQVASGELSLDLDYAVEGGRLSAENRIVLDALELADRVESDRAADLPLDLAIALLRDADGRIELNVPVSGDVTDPSFDLTPAIMRALRGAIAGVVTSPFRMLGSLIGAKQPLDGVDFPFGEATPVTSGEAVLADIARVLERRPGLALALTPVHGGPPDRDALRLADLEQRIAAEGLPRAQALASLASAEFGADYVAALRRQYGEVEDVDAAMAAELEGVLLERVELEAGALDALARDRAAAVAEALLAAGLAPERVKTGAVEERTDLASERMRLPFELEARRASD
ncbi:MAG: DUF748 domain-containing protein [Pseudomonadales bacterium]|jgi:hypothetical protein|nr:DUF748 domain-containing protein [Pseudomonadales bacterium]